MRFRVSPHFVQLRYIICSLFISCFSFIFNFVVIYDQAAEIRKLVLNLNRLFSPSIHNQFRRKMKAFIEFKLPPTLDNVKNSIFCNFEKVKNDPESGCGWRIHDPHQSQNLITFHVKKCTFHNLIEIYQ